MHYVELFNYYMYTMGAYIYVCQFSFHLYETIVHVKGKPKKGSSTTTASLSPIDVRKTWYARLGLIIGMVLGVALGGAVMLLWYWLKLVHVTRHEYALIIIPVQITLSITATSVFQAMSEKERLVPKRRELSKEAAYEDLTIEDMTQLLSIAAKTGTDVKLLRKILAIMRSMDQNLDQAEEKESDKKGEEADEKSDHISDEHVLEPRATNEETVDV